MLFLTRLQTFVAVCGMLCFLGGTAVHAQDSPGGIFSGGGGLGGGATGGQQGAGGAAGAGGQSLADFSQLMQLIQTTIDPESWEALGGVGTMAPYPAGIVVDPNGLLREDDSRPAADTAALDNARSLLLRAARSGDENLSDETATDWKSPAPIRCVSLRRWMQTLAANPSKADRSTAVDFSDDPLNLAGGLSKVTMVMMTDDDIVLAGPVGGFRRVDGWWVDQTTGLPPMNLTAMAVGLSAAINEQPFGCTIDPTEEGLRAAAATGQAISRGDVPMGLAAETLAEKLGRQDIRVFGTSGGHDVAWLLIEADRHMKRLALGDVPMPRGTRDYLETIEATAGNSPPTDLLLRLWFTANPMSVRTSRVESTRLWQLSGTPVRLSGDNELALLNGQRGNRVLDPNTEAFVDHFNQQWVTIRSQYPLYGGLESVFQATAIAQLWTQNSGQANNSTNDHKVLQKALLHFAAQRAPRLETPTQVESIAVMHRYKKGRKMHQLVLASGGVSVAPDDLLRIELEPHPSLNIYADLTQQRPTDRWWWNGQR